MTSTIDFVVADDAVRFSDLSWHDLAKIASERRVELIAIRCELDRANAEVVRLRHDLIDLQQLMRSK